MKILVVDDEQAVVNSLIKFLNKMGHEVTTSNNGADALEKFHKNKYDLIITDINMPNIDGLELLRRIKKVEKATTEVVIITGYGDMDNTLKALKFGAYDYLQKPVDVRELAIIIERCREHRLIRERYNELKLNIDTKIEKEVLACHLMVDHFRDIYFDELGIEKMMVFSDRMRSVMEEASKVSRNQKLNVLIEGNSGTGKDLMAKYIHYMSPNKRKQPFIPINCSAIPEHLVESELFGYEGGAYTNSKREGGIGKIELAGDGTIFLDEIGEMPLEIQAKLLRVVEDRRYYRIGGSEEIPVKARFIFATNKDLLQEVKKGKFRLDLYYRINVGQIKIPSLKERKEDIIPLANHFATKFFPRAANIFFGFSSSAKKMLVNHSWPGNIRELKNIIEQLSYSNLGQRITRNDIEKLIGGSNIERTEREVSNQILNLSKLELPDNEFNLDKHNKMIIEKTLDKFKGNKTEAARYLGISRRSMYTKIKKHGLKL